MRMNMRLFFAISLALLISFAVACKLGSSPSTSSEKTGSASGSSTANAATAGTAPAANIAGKYNITGTNPNGAPYKGTLEIIAHGDVYQFRWNAGAQYDGVGILNGNVVAVAFASGEKGEGCGVVDYMIRGDGALDGKWGYWGVNESGTERATRSSGSGLEGEYDATGRNPNGKEYKVRITVRPAGELYKFVWSNNTDGIGIKRGANVAVGIGGERCGFVAYEIRSDGTLDGVWGGSGAETTGTEKAIRQ
jgi:hypothetical protein